MKAISSSSRMSRTRPMTDCFACSIFSPDIEPEVSRTTARESGARSRASCAVRSAASSISA
jgi:hypothetical protein